MKMFKFKKIISSILTILATAVLFVGCNSTGQVDELTKAEKIEDFQYMYDVIKEGYPYLEVNKRLFNVDWLANKEKYIEIIEKTRNDEEFVSELNRILRELNNDHTGMLNTPEIYEMFKGVYSEVGWYNFWENEEVVDRYKKLGDGNQTSKSTSNEEYILKDIIDGEVGYIYIPEMIARGESIEDDITEIAEYIKTVKGYEGIVIDIRGNTGGSDQYWIEIVSRLIIEDCYMSGYTLFRSSDVMDKYIESREINIQDIDELPKCIIDKGPEEILNQFSYFIKNNNKILRHDSIDFEGDIFLLVDDIVYSAAESFAIFSKESGFATLIGEKTSGDGGGYDPVLFNLKNSGLIVRMASDMYLTDSGVCNEEFKTEPHYIIEDVSRTSDFKDDECIKKVLELMGKTN